MMKQILDHSYCSLTTAVHAESVSWLQLRATFGAYVLRLLYRRGLHNDILGLRRLMGLHLRRLTGLRLCDVLRGNVWLNLSATGTTELVIGC